MQPYTYARATTMAEALTAAALPGAMVMAGGTTMVDLMRADLTRPRALVDIAHLPELGGIDTSGDTIRLGTLARMADVAEDATIRREYPALAESLQLAASQQLRNAATVGGNLLQRTRCFYFRDGVSACNKREPGAGCAAQTGGLTREMALFGGSDQCVATYPGDWAIALLAFDAVVETARANGNREIPLGELHVPYGQDPIAETVLGHGEIITAIRVPKTPAGRRSVYLKVRDRQSYAYAVVSTAVALEMDGDTVRAARVALGGVATAPWRSAAAEVALAGVTLSEQTALAAGDAAFADAQPLRDNGVKIELGRRVIAKALLTAARRA